MDGSRVSYHVLVTIVSLSILWDVISTYRSILDSPPSPTIVRASEWDLCGRLEIWALGWRTLLHASAALLVRAIMLEDYLPLWVLRRTALVPIVWFVYGSILVWYEGSRCRACAPQTWSRAMGNYVVVSAGLLLYTVLACALNVARYFRPVETSRLSRNEKGGTVSIADTKETPGGMVEGFDAARLHVSDRMRHERDAFSVDIA